MAQTRCWGRIISLFSSNGYFFTRKSDYDDIDGESQSWKTCKVQRFCCFHPPHLLTFVLCIQGVSKKTSCSQSWPWRILLLTVRNQNIAFASASKTGQWNASRLAGDILKIKRGQWLEERRYHFAIVRYVTQPDDRYMKYKTNHLHLSRNMMADFSLSAVIFTTFRLDYNWHQVCKLRCSHIQNKTLN